MKRIALRWLGALLLSITLAAPALAAGKHYFFMGSSC